MNLSVFMKHAHETITRDEPAAPDRLIENTVYDIQMHDNGELKRAIEAAVRRQPKLDPGLEQKASVVSRCAQERGE